MGVSAARRRVLVTGAAGHVGARLVDALAARGDIAVRALMRRATDAPFARDTERIIGDLADRSLCRDAVADCDAIVHLASVPADVTDTSLAIATQTTMVSNLLDAAEATGVRRFVHLSTVHVYGERLRGTVDEGTLVSPVTAYGSAHLAAERVVHSDAGSRVSHLTLRCANGFGASATRSTAPWRLVTGDVCVQAVRGHELLLNTHGRHQRDFVALTDVVRCISHFALDRDDVGTILLGSGVSMTLRQFAELVADRARIAFGRDYVVRHHDDDDAPAVTYRLDTRRLHECGFVPANDFVAEVDALLVAASARIGELP